MKIEKKFIRIEKFKLSGIEGMQRQIFLNGNEEGIYTIRELFFDTETKKRYWLEREELKRKVYFRIDDQYIMNQKVTWVIDSFIKCSDLEVDYLILPLYYQFQGSTLEAISILAQKLNCIVASNPLSTTQLIIENGNLDIKEMSYLVQALHGRVKVILNIDKFEGLSFNDLFNQIIKYDLQNFIHAIKTEKHQLNIKKYSEDDSFNNFLTNITHNDRITLSEDSSLRILID
jgi:hypothetical protein